jgi:hypothetical protein
VDGAILINQNTSVNGLPGCPHAGFPIVICQSGSYRLSGSLTMNTSASGNYSGLDIAIAIGSSNITLDLNGFSITVNDTIGDSLTHNIYGISEIGTFSQVSIRNGAIRITTTATDGSRLFGAFLASSHHLNIQDLTIIVHAANVSKGSLGTALDIGQGSLIRRNVTDGNILYTCPSVVVENLGFISSNAFLGCPVVNNGGETILIP